MFTRDKSLPPPIKGALTGHWPTFLVSAFNLFFDRFIYYGLRAMLILMLVEFTSQSQSLEIYAAYGALVYLAALIMGLVGDLFLERRQSTAIGAGLIGIGYLTLYMSVFHGIGSPIVGLAISAVGTGLLRTANITMLFNAFPFQGRQLVTTYLIYVLINVGAFFAPLVWGWFSGVKGFQWPLLTLGILALGWSAALFLFYSSELIPSEASEHRSSLSRMETSPLLGVIFAGVACILVAVLGYGLLELNEKLFNLLIKGFFAFFSLAAIVLMLVLGRNSLFGIVTLVVGVLAMALFWASVEGVWGGLHQLAYDMQLSVDLNLVNGGLSIWGCLVLAAIGIAIPIKGKKGTVVVGALVVMAWLFGMLLLLLYGSGGKLFGEDGSGIVWVFALLTVVEILLGPPMFLWIYRALPGGFRSAGFGLLFSSSYLSIPISASLSDGPMAGWQSIQVNAAGFLPWVGLVFLALLTLVVLWAVLPGQRRQ